MKKVLAFGECPFCHSVVPATHQAADNWDELASLPKQAQSDPSLFQLTLHRMEDGVSGSVCCVRHKPPIRIIG